jgi:four helix bundle protein
MAVDSILKQKSLRFAQRIVRLYQYLISEQRETVMSKQILRSGTSIGANISEAIYASSRRDFAAKLQIARKEAAETLYWLELLYRCNYLSEKQYDSMSQDCSELIAILTSTNKSLEDT